MPSMKSIHASYFEISCVQGFWLPHMTSTKNTWVFPLNTVNPYTKFEKYPWFLSWDTIFTKLASKTQTHTHTCHHDCIASFAFRRESKSDHILDQSAMALGKRKIVTSIGHKWNHKILHNGPFSIKSRNLQHFISQHNSYPVKMGVKTDQIHLTTFVASVFS